MTPRYKPRLGIKRPTPKQVRLAFAAQRPLDSTATVPAKPKREKRGDDNLDGIGGTDGTHIKALK